MDVMTEPEERQLNTTMDLGAGSGRAERFPSTPLPETPDPEEELWLDEDTLKVPRVSLKWQADRNASTSVVLVPETEEFVEEVGTEPLPVKRIRRASKRNWLDDPWFVITILISYIASIGAFWYFYQAHQTVLYGDALSHMLITRRVFDNATPGLAQLGGVWLPLPHLVMLPFIWNDYLWRTGLAGTIPSMICYLVAAVYLFLAARRLTKDSRASFVGTLLFMLNPNVLYLQTTALSEIVLIATLTASSYYFLAWAQEDRLNDLILAAVATFLATLARYDGWMLFLAFFITVALIGRLKHRSRPQIEGQLILFGSLGGLGIALWFGWCYLIFGDPLFFQRGPYSSQAQQRSLIDAHVLFTYHDLWQSIRYFAIDCMQNVGPTLFVLGVIAVVIFALRRGLTSEMLAGLIFLVPFVFYVVALYGGQAAIYAPGAVAPNFAHQLYNARYGVEIVAPVALFIAALASRMTLGHFRALGQVVLVGVIVVQTSLTAFGGIVSLQDGQFGLDCAHQHPIVIFLAQHYGGGRILEDLYTTKIDELNPGADIAFKNIIYEGSGRLWLQALRNPTAMVDWIIINPADKFDLVARNLNPEFNAEYTRDIEESNGLSLYQRNGLMLPTRPVPSYQLNVHALCDPTSTGSVGILSPGGPQTGKVSPLASAAVPGAVETRTGLVERRSELYREQRGAWHLS
jgi:Dolichyl-phosphate-mannose-protein mannosyltransferase